jgi:hypothetical protein
MDIHIVVWDLKYKSYLPCDRSLTTTSLSHAMLTDVIMQ